MSLLLFAVSALYRPFAGPVSWIFPRSLCKNLCALMLTRLANVDFNILYFYFDKWVTSYLEFKKHEKSSEFVSKLHPRHWLLAYRGWGEVKGFGNSPRLFWQWSTCSPSKLLWSSQTLWGSPEDWSFENKHIISSWDVHLKFPVRVSVNLSWWTVGDVQMQPQEFTLCSPSVLMNQLLPVTDLRSSARRPGCCVDGRSIRNTAMSWGFPHSVVVLFTIG